MSKEKEPIEVKLKYFTIEDIKEMLEKDDRSKMPSQISFMIDQFKALNSITPDVSEEDKNAQIGIAIYLWERAFDDGALQIFDFVKDVVSHIDYKFDYDDTLPIMNTVYDPELTKEKFKKELDEFIVTLTNAVCKKICDNIFNSELYKAINGLPLEEDTIVGVEKISDGDKE